jgi:hypothetical protein
MMREPNKACFKKRFTARFAKERKEPQSLYFPQKDSENKNMHALRAD